MRMRVSFSIARRALRSSGSHSEIATPALPGPRRAPDAVHIDLGQVRDFEIDHVGDVVDVDPARGHVGRNQHRDVAAAEGGQRPFARRLALVAMDRRRRDARAIEEGHYLVGALLGAG